MIEKYTPSLDNEHRVEFDYKTDEIPDNEIKVKAIQGGGPGGQAVNKTSSKVEIRWNFEESKSLSTKQKDLLREVAGNKITNNNELIFTSQSERSQLQNIVDAKRRLNEFVRDGLTPKKTRKTTKKSRGVRARERRSRERKSKIKSQRGRGNWDND